MPTTSRKSAERNALIVLAYFPPWVLDYKAVSQHVHHAENLPGSIFHVPQRHCIDTACVCLAG